MGRWQRNCSPETTKENAKQREDAAFNLFAEMLIEKIKTTAKTEWKQPWFAEGELAWPKSLYGKPYHGMNALMLSFLCEKNGWRIPVFATHARIESLNRQKNADGEIVPAVDKDGNRLPLVHVLKGEHCFPVFLSQLNIVHKDTHEKIKWAEYQRLSPEEKEEYNLYHNRRVHYVFNVDQTNLKEARPELYAKLEKENIPQKVEDDGPEVKCAPVDVMVDKQLWICPIKVQELMAGDSPHYAIGANEIVVGLKSQYQATGHAESWVNDLFHEMTHSTGHSAYLNRFQGDSSRDSYAREELVAEIGAALSCHRLGIDKTIKADSIPYVQNWLDALHEKPEFIRTVLKDVKAATNIIDNKIDEIRQKYLGEGDKLDVREEDESVLEYDELGDAHLAEGESLGADRKQGEVEAAKVIALEPETHEERRVAGIHR